MVIKLERFSSRLSGGQEKQKNKKKQDTDTVIKDP